MAPYNPPDSHYAHINLPVFMNEDCIKYIIGKKGLNLYNWTTKTNLEYIWLDMKNKRIELWGSYSALSLGARDEIYQYITDRIHKFNTKDMSINEINEYYS